MSDTPEVPVRTADTSKVHEGQGSPIHSRGASVGLRNISKHYKSVRAIDDVTLTVGEGEFMALLGPSGSGKTTLLMSVAGFEQPDSGSIWIGEREVTTVPAYKRDLGTVFQRYALFPHMTVADNIAYPLKVRGVRGRRRQTRVADALDLVNMAQLGTRRVDQLSGGQQQRVALARALVYEPRVLLMDEPLGALDRNLREQIQLEIRRLHREVGVTVLYVTHDQSEALTMADRIAILSDGKLLQVDTPQQMYDRPRTSFVASFLGQTNNLACVIAEDVIGQESLVVVIGDRRMPATFSADAFASRRRPVPGDPMSISVRPEHVVLNQDGKGLPGRVVDIVFSGPTTDIIVDSGAGQLTVREMSGLRAQALNVGAPVWLDWAAHRAHAFPLRPGGTGTPSDQGVGWKA